MIAASRSKPPTILVSGSTPDISRISCDQIIGVSSLHQTVSLASGAEARIRLTTSDQRT
jgi:hypothetical protein